VVNIALFAYLRLQNIQKMKKSILSLIFGCCFFAAFAQFEGPIVYGVSLPDAGGENGSLMASMMPSEATLMVGKSKSRVEMKMGMGMQNITIVDKKTNEAVVLMDMMGNKMAMTITEKDVQKGKEKSSFKLKSLDKGDNTIIAGFPCKHAVYEDENGSQFDVYYSEKFGKETYSGSMDNPFKEVKGLMLKYTVATNGIKMTMTAKSVTEGKIDESKFIVPSDYKKVSQDDIRKMYGGGK
jgi:hypothetical protein